MIALAKFQSTRGASHHPALMGNWPTSNHRSSPSKPKTSLETWNLVVLILVYCVRRSSGLIVLILKSRIRRCDHT